MEPIFECEFQPTVKMIAGRIRKYNPVRSIIMLLAGIGFAAFVLPGVIWYRFEGVWALYGLLSIAYLIFGIFMPDIYAWLSVRRFRKETGGEGIYRITFGDNIEIRQGNIRVSWAYSDINQVFHLRHTYELAKSKHLTVMVDPDGFTKGTFAEFKQFLRAKRPDLNIPE